MVFHSKETSSSKPGRVLLHGAASSTHFSWKIVMSAGFLTSPPLWLSGANPAGESEGRVGNAEPTNGTAGKRLQGVGTLTQPVGQEITGQLALNCSVFLKLFI